MALLDAEEFNTAGGIRRDKVVPFVIRTEKRQAINERGDPLFLPSLTKLITVHWEERHELQKRLYHSVTEYVRWGYDQAIRQNRQYLGFLMILMQRLVTSSTRAIASALERRLEALNATDSATIDDGPPENSVEEQEARNAWTNFSHSGWRDWRTRRNKSGCYSICLNVAERKAQMHGLRRCSISSMRTSARRTTQN